MDPYDFGIYVMLPPQEISVSHCLSSEGTSSGPLQSHQQIQPLSFLAIDIYASLVFSILKVGIIDSGIF